MSDVHWIADVIQLMRQQVKGQCDTLPINLFMVTLTLSQNALPFSQRYPQDVTA